MAKVAAKVYIEGFVQGIGFRQYVYRKSQECGVRGYVRNLRDGRVQVYAEGDQGTMDNFLMLLRRGPVGARVKSMQVLQAPYTGQYKEFSILFDI